MEFPEYVGTFGVFTLGTLVGMLLVVMLAHAWTRWRKLPKAVLEIDLHQEPKTPGTMTIVQELPISPHEQIVVGSPNLPMTADNLKILMMALYAQGNPNTYSPLNARFRVVKDLVWFEGEHSCHADSCGCGPGMGVHMVVYLASNKNAILLDGNANIPELGLPHVWVKVWEGIWKVGTAQTPTAQHVESVYRALLADVREEAARKKVENNRLVADLGERWKESSLPEKGKVGDNEAS